MHFLLSCNFQVPVQSCTWQAEPIPSYVLCLRYGSVHLFDPQGDRRLFCAHPASAVTMREQGFRASRYGLLRREKERPQMKRYIQKNSSKNPLRSGEIRFRSGEKKEIGKQVREKLPKYMFPSKYIRLDAMPHNANGKIDRKKLAAK